MVEDRLKLAYGEDLSGATRSVTSIVTRLSCTTRKELEGEGSLIVIKNREEEILACLTSKEILELCDSAMPLPNEFYAAFMRRAAISTELMKLILCVSYETAQKILTNAIELAKFDEQKRRAKLSMPSKVEEPPKVRQIKLVPGMVKDSDVSIAGRIKEEK